MISDFQEPPSRPSFMLKKSKIVKTGICVYSKISDVIEAHLYLYFCLSTIKKTNEMARKTLTRHEVDVV